MTGPGPGRGQPGMGRASSLMRRWRPALTGGALFLVALLLTASPAPPASAEPPGDITDRVAELRELSLEPIPVEPMTQGELRQWLVGATQKQLADIAATQELCVFLDLLDEGDDLLELTVDSNTTGLAGFYSYEEGRLCLISDSAAASEPLAKVILAHEYTHALQDQHFGLSTFLDPGAAGSRQARLALVEGDATMVMAMYLDQDMTLEEQEAVAELAAMPGMELSTDVPVYLQMSSQFTYLNGLEFVRALWEEEGWEGVNRAYEDPPASTEQIMHPRKYFRHRDDPVEVALPDLAAALGPDWSEVDSGVLGEFDLKLYLWRYLGEDDAGEAAEGWGGDAYSLSRNDAGEHVFVLSTIWDEADEAREFYDACVERYPDRSGSGTHLEAEGSQTSGEWLSRDRLYCRLALDGERVYLALASDGDAAASGRAMSAIYSPPSRVWIWALVGVGVFFLACALVGAEVLVRRRVEAQRAAGPPAPPGSPAMGPADGPVPIDSSAAQPPLPPAEPPAPPPIS